MKKQKDNTSELDAALLDINTAQTNILSCKT